MRKRSRKKKLVFADVTHELLRADGSVVLETKVLGEAIDCCRLDDVVEVRETAHHNKDAKTTVGRAEFLGRYL